jgi:hypothetical protein
MEQSFISAQLKKQCIQTHLSEKRNWLLTKGLGIPNVAVKYLQLK